MHCVLSAMVVDFDRDGVWPLQSSGERWSRRMVPVRGLPSRRNWN